MEISDQSRKLSWDFSHGTHGAGCKFRGTSPRRRRTRTKAAGGGRRRLKWGRSDTATPVVEWKSNGFAAAGSAPVAAEGGGGGGRIRLVRGGVAVGKSARKLAAGMWRNFAAVRNCSGGGGGGGVTWHGQHDPLLFRLDSQLGNAKTAMWDHIHNISPIEVCEFHSSYLRLLKNKHNTELIKARNRVKELETERHFFKKKLKHFLKELGREMASSARRELRKMFLIVEELKDELERERRNCQKTRNFSSKLMNDLADAKLSTEQMMQALEKEKRARELLENVCHELGKDIQEHQANIRAMKIEFVRIQEEVEEERRMMQLSEVWREERVQMKLVDAKMILEEKYAQMNNVIADLESFLRSNNGTPEVRGDAMDSMVSVQDSSEAIKKLPADINGGSEIQSDQLSDGLSSELLNISSEAIESIKNLLHVHSDHETIIDQETKTRNKHKNKGSQSQRKLWKSSPTAADILKTIPIDENLRPKKGSNLNSSFAVISAETISEEVFNHSELVSHWCLPGQRNPHIDRAMRGCIEWPRGIQRNGFLKASVFEARLENQKTQLRNVLKQRMK